MGHKLGEEAMTASAKSLAKIPELDGQIWQDLDVPLPAEKESLGRYIRRSYLTYVKVFRLLGSLSESDLITLAKTERLVRKDELIRARSSDSSVVKGSSAEYEVMPVLSKLGVKVRKDLANTMLQGGDADSSVYRGALQELRVRLLLGSYLAQQGQAPSDDNPNFKVAYFGHTMKLSPKAMVHFVLSHYMTRAFQAKYGTKSRLTRLAFDKDSLHDVLSAGIRIMMARREQYPEIVEIAELWAKKRSEGGLQWHNDKYDPESTIDPKQRFYDEAFGTQSK